jgi:hypothetical protein
MGFLRGCSRLATIAALFVGAGGFVAAASPTAYASGTTPAAYATSGSLLAAAGLVGLRRPRHVAV